MEENLLNITTLTPKTSSLKKLQALKKCHHIDDCTFFFVEYQHIFNPFTIILRLCGVFTIHIPVNELLLEKDHININLSF